MSNATDWCILRCSGANTLPLAKSLTGEGLDVWTPIEQITRRVPRFNVKRTIYQPMMPSYLFARASQLSLILALCEAAHSRHRDFRIFHLHGRMPLIADAALAPLRLLERKSRITAKTAPRINAGDHIRMSDGSFAGMAGTVDHAGGQFSTVTLQGFSMPVKIANFYLLQSDGNSETRRVA